MQWYKTYHDERNHPQKRYIANKLSVPIHYVHTIWSALSLYALQNTEEPGSVNGIDIEMIAILEEMDIEIVSNMYFLFIERKLIVNHIICG